MKKKIFLSCILLLVFIIVTTIFINTNFKKISTIGGFKSTDITKVDFQYDNPGIKGGSVENKDKIDAFMNYINNCVFTRKLIQTKVSGYYQMVIFFIGDKEVMRIMTYDKFIEINGTQYNMVKNKLSLEKIDDFLQSQ